MVVENLRRALSPLSVEPQQYQSLLTKARTETEKNKSPPYGGFSSRVFLDADHKFGLVYVPDFSRIAIDYNIAVSEQGPVSIGLSESLDIIIEPEYGVVVFKYDVSVRQIPEAIYESPSYFPKLIKRKLEQERLLQRNFHMTEHAISNGDFKEVPLRDLWDSTVNFNSLQLDLWMPHWAHELLLQIMFPELPETQRKEMLLKIQMPRYRQTYFMEQHADLLNLLEQKYFGETPDVDGFISRVAHLNTYDLKPGPLEDPLSVGTKILEYSRYYPNLQSIREERERRQFSNRIQRMEQTRLLGDISDRINKLPYRMFFNKTELPDWGIRFLQWSGKHIKTKEELVRFVNEMFEYIPLAMDYDQENRTYRSGAYRIFRKLAQHFFQDIDKPTIDELLGVVKTK